MTRAETITWAAAMFEGEGCCSWTSREHNCQEAMVKQTDPTVLYWLAQAFGGRVTPHQETNRLSNKPTNRWRLFGANARAFLAMIYPLLSPRRKAQIARIDVFDEAELVGIS